MDDTTWSNALDFYYRRSEISLFYIDFEDTLRVLRANPKVSFRYTVFPTEPPMKAGLIPISATD